MFKWPLLNGNTDMTAIFIDVFLIVVALYFAYRSWRGESEQNARLYHLEVDVSNLKRAQVQAAPAQATQATQAPRVDVATQTTEAAPQAAVKPAAKPKVSFAAPKPVVPKPPVTTFKRTPPAPAPDSDSGSDDNVVLSVATGALDLTVDSQ